MEQDRIFKSSYLSSVPIKAVYAANSLAICLTPSYKSFVPLASITSRFETHLQYLCRVL